MAHQIEQMAYVGATPWHGLGNNLPQNQPIEVWQREAGMDWQIEESPVHFKSDAVGHLGAIHSFPEQKVLFRSDTKAPLSVVSNRYHTVQPREVLEFYRDLTALGHEVKLMPPVYVKPYVKRGKTDAADAEEIAEAVTRPTMRFVAIKSKEQQAALMLHKTRDLLIRQRTMLINALRGHLGEYGIVAARGPIGVRTALASVRERRDELPPAAVAALEAVAHQLAGLDEAISGLERRILAWHQASETSRRLATIPGIQSRK